MFDPFGRYVEKQEFFLHMDHHEILMADERQNLEQNTDKAWGSGSGFH